MALYGYGLWSDDLYSYGLCSYCPASTPTVAAKYEHSIVQTEVRVPMSIHLCEHVR